VNLPVCPRGHESVKVVRDGAQKRGGRERQRYRCVLEDGSYHRFVGAVSHTRGDGRHCDECDRPLPVDGGPVAPWRSRYLVKEVAAALWAVAGGASYTDAALRVRRRAWGDDGTDRRAETTVVSGQTVADWLDRYGPAVAAPHGEAGWPETIVLDSTRFLYRDSFTGRQHQLFSVLAAWGYPAGSSRGRLWLLRAYPLQDAPTWQQFLAELPGRPQLVVIDRDYGAIGGVQRRWGHGARGVPIHLCEHHLYENGKAALVKGGHTAFGDPLQAALAKALQSPEGWHAFHTLASEAGSEPQKWADHWDKRMRVQTKRRTSIPEHYANGAVEAPLEEVRRILAQRRWTFRNAARMNQLLELVRIRYNHAADESDFASALRGQLLDSPRPARAVAADPRLPGRRVSASSLRAWMPQQPARHQRWAPTAKMTPPPPTSAAPSGRATRSAVTTRAPRRRGVPRPPSPRPGS
jgi:hypothetical protein